MEEMAREEATEVKAVVGLGGTGAGMGAARNAPTVR